MKKILKLVLGIFILIILSELLLYILKDSHNYSYKIKTKNTQFDITEIYKNKTYYFKIKTKKEVYSFETKDDFHKSKGIIKEIKTYKTKDNALCIYPVLKKEGYSNIICSKKNKAFSYTYYQKELIPFIKKLQNQKYTSKSWNKKSESAKKIETLTAYQKNIKENTYIYIYKYNGFYSINKKSLEKIKLFKNDTYINHLGTNTGKYYIIPNYDQKYDYNQLYVINMKNDKIKTKNIKITISKDSYINGIIDDSIYIFDKDELKQYKISKKAKKITEVGNKEKGGIYYDLKFKNRNIYDFKDKELKFKTKKTYLKKVENISSITHIENNKDTYYYQTKDGNMYYYNANNKVKVLLFNKKMSDTLLVNDTLYFISDDTLYSYNFLEGISKLAVYSELSFSSKNRIAIYTEEK